MSEKHEEHHEEGNPMIKIAGGIVAIGVAIWAFLKMFGSATADFMADVAMSAAQYTATKTGIIAMGIGVGIAVIAILGGIALGIKFFAAGKEPPAAAPR